MTLVQLDRYINAILGYRWPVVALAVLVVLITGAGGRFIKTTNDYRIMFGENNPQLAAFNALEKTFSTSDTAIDAQVVPDRLAVVIVGEGVDPDRFRHAPQGLGQLLDGAERLAGEYRAPLGSHCDHRRIGR